MLCCEISIYLFIFILPTYNIFLNFSILDQDIFRTGFQHLDRKDVINVVKISFNIFSYINYASAFTGR